MTTQTPVLVLLKYVDGVEFAPVGPITFAFWSSVREADDIAACCLCNEDACREVVRC